MQICGIELDYHREKQSIAEKIRQRYQARGQALCFSLLGFNNSPAYNWPRREPTCSRELVTALVPWRIVFGVSELLRNTPDVTREKSNFPPPVAPIIFQFRFVDNFLNSPPSSSAVKLTLTMRHTSLREMESYILFVELITCVRRQKHIIIVLYKNVFIVTLANSR